MLCSKHDTQVGKPVENKSSMQQATGPYDDDGDDDEGEDEKCQCSGPAEEDDDGDEEVC